jgi:hypothetical protein
MSDQESSFITSRIELIDTQSGFSCGKHQLDDYFARYALANDQAGIGRAYVFRRSPDDENDLPNVLGFYTLSMALAESAQVSMVKNSHDYATGAGAGELTVRVTV